MRGWPFCWNQLCFSKYYLIKTHFRTQEYIASDAAFELAVEVTDAVFIVIPCARNKRSHVIEDILDTAVQA